MSVIFITLGAGIGLGRDEHWDIPVEAADQWGYPPERIGLLQEAEVHPGQEHQAIPLLQEAEQGGVQGVLHLSGEVLSTTFPQDLPVWTQSILL